MFGIEITYPRIRFRLSSTENEMQEFFLRQIFLFTVFASLKFLYQTFDIFPPIFAS